MNTKEIMAFFIYLTKLERAQAHKKSYNGSDQWSI